MSYAIIRNVKYTASQINGIYRHNERKNTNYSNKDINRDKSKENYSIKTCNMPYSKAFRIIKEKYNLQGWIKKTSNIACEYIITSDKEFFETIGKEETKRYFKVAYEFVKSYKNLGENYILSARVHNDESTPHMHLVFIPVVHSKDKNGKTVDKISCTDFWKGKNSYRILQDNFYKYMTRAGFKLERGKESDRKNLSVKDYKELTEYEVQKFENKTALEKELETRDFKELQVNYKRLINKFNTLARQYSKVKNITDDIVDKQIKQEEQIKDLLKRNNDLELEKEKLLAYIENTFEYVNLLFDFPKERLIRLIDDFIEKSK